MSTGIIQNMPFNRKDYIARAMDSRKEKKLSRPPGSLQDV